MSLKAFHAFFIFCSFALCAFLGYWQWGIYREAGQVASLIWGLSGAISAVGLLVYLFWFLKKSNIPNG